MRIRKNITLSFLFTVSVWAGPSAPFNLPRPPLNSLSWPLLNAQHEQFLQWARHRVLTLSAESELDAKEDFSLTPEERTVKRTTPLWISLETSPVPSPDPEALHEIRRTTDLYFRYFGKNTFASFIWSGVESGNTLTSDMTYRWNSLRESGFYDPRARAKIIRSLKKTGVRNLRFGFSNHEIFKNPDGSWNEASWRRADAMIRELTEAGFSLALDLHHFGIESRFCVDSAGRPATYMRAGEILCDKARYDPTRSFYLHPAWPDYYADFSLEVFRRYHSRVRVFTLINEPETVKGFNSGLWNGAFPGWLHPPMPTAGYYEAERAIKIGIAAVRARLKIEDYIRREGLASDQHPLFLHAEALVPKPHWPEFNEFVRFITSDTILGVSWVMEPDFEKLKQLPLSEVEKHLGWTPNLKLTVLNLLTVQSIWQGFHDSEIEKEARKRRFFDLLSELQKAHRQLRSEFHMSMRSYTILGLDYYAHNEEFLSPQPVDYLYQIRAGKRVGLFQTALAYFARFQMPIMISETGTPFFLYATRWHQQLLLECAKIAFAGIPFLAYTVYPAVDTYGWEHALSRAKEPLYRARGSLYNPSGILYMQKAPPPEVGVVGFRPLEAKRFIFDLEQALGFKNPGAQALLPQEGLAL